MGRYSNRTSYGYVLSIFSTDKDRPIKTCALSSAFFRSNFVFLITTSSRNLRKFSKKSFKLQVLGLLLTIAKVLKPKELSMEVNLNICLFIVSGSTFVLKSIATRIPGIATTSVCE